MKIWGRWARNPDGSTEILSPDMAFDEWRQQFIQRADSGLTPPQANGTIKLSDAEKRALKDYISSGSYKINAPLREGWLLSEEQQAMVDALDTALEKIPVYKGTVYRSITDFDIEDIDAFFADYVPGKVLPFPAYTSSSTKIYDKSFPIQYIIQSKSGRDIRGFNPGEYEILFPRNTSFQVIQVQRNTIFMEEV